MSRIAIVGASGMIGQRVVLEALVRGHDVKALVRAPERFPIAHPRLAVVKIDLFDVASVAEAIADADVLVNATGAGHDGTQVPESFFLDSARSLVAAVEQAGGEKRLIVVGGAGSLEVAPGVQLVDTPEFPEIYLAIATAQRATVPLYRNSTISWSFFSPSAVIAPGRRTTKYRFGKNQLQTNDQGESFISVEDFAYALLDEIEQPQHIRQHFTAVSLEK